MIITIIIHCSIYILSNKNPNQLILKQKEKQQVLNL